MIKLNNKNLANYVEFKIDKLDNNFTEDELLKIEEVVIDFKVETDSIKNILEDVLKLKNIMSLTIRNGYISKEACKMLMNLKKLNDLAIENCEVENHNLLALLNLKSMSILNCGINDYAFLRLFKGLERLELVRENVNVNLINKLANLKYLQLSYSEITNIGDIVIDNIEEIYLDNTNYNSFEFLNDMPNLKRVSIDNRQYENNKELFKTLEAKNILVLNENMVLFGE